MRRIRRGVLIVLAGAAFTALAIGVSGRDEPSDAEWCAASNELWEAAIAVEGAESIDDAPLEDWERLERAGDELRTMKAPPEIRDAVAVAYSPRRFADPPGGQDPKPYRRAEAAVIRWALDNCGLSEQVRDGLEDAYEEAVEFVGGPDTTAVQ